MLVIKPTTIVSSANLMIEVEECMAMQSWINREYRRGPSVEGQQSGDVVSYLHHLVVDRQKVQDPVAQGGGEIQGLQLDDELGGYYGVEC